MHDTLSPRATTNLAICLMLMIYFASSVFGFMIFVHLATCKDPQDALQRFQVPQPADRTLHPLQTIGAPRRRQRMPAVVGAVPHRQAERRVNHARSGRLNAVGLPRPADSDARNSGAVEPGASVHVRPMRRSVCASLPATQAIGGRSPLQSRHRRSARAL